MDSTRGGIALVGFDADDTLWKSQDYFDEAQAEFERIHTEILTQLPGVVRVQSTLALRSVKKTTSLPL